jgi:type II secretory pathway component PulK
MSESGAQRGYILAATLWVLAIVAILAAGFTERVGTSVEMARQAARAAEAMRDVASARAEMLYRLAVTPLRQHGLGVAPQSAVALDDRPYVDENGTEIRLQDARGLVQINLIDEDILRRLLTRMGVAPERHGRLIDTLNDFTDSDDLKRLNGAEADEYRALGLPPPPNDWLITASQLRGILGWREETALWRDARFLDMVTTARVTGFNPNTAPREVLALLPGYTPELADKIVAQRGQAPIPDYGQLYALTGLPVDLDRMFIAFVPAGTLRLTLRGREQPWAYRYQITLTPASPQSPWSIDHAFKMVLPSRAHHESPAPLPERAALGGGPRALD